MECNNIEMLYRSLCAALNEHILNYIRAGEMGCERLL